PNITSSLEKPKTKLSVLSMSTTSTSAPNSSESRVVSSRPPNPAPSTTTRMTGTLTARSPRLDDEETVPVEVAEEELRGNRIGHGRVERDEASSRRSLLRGLGVDVAAAGEQGCVDGFDVVRRDGAVRRVSAGR